MMVDEEPSYRNAYSLIRCWRSHAAWREGIKEWRMKLMCDDADGKAGSWKRLYWTVWLFGAIRPCSMRNRADSAKSFLTHNLPALVQVQFFFKLCAVCYAMISGRLRGLLVDKYFDGFTFFDFHIFRHLRWINAYCDVTCHRYQLHHEVIV